MHSHPEFRYLPCWYIRFLSRGNFSTVFLIYVLKQWGQDLPFMQGPRNQVTEPYSQSYVKERQQRDKFQAAAVEWVNSSRQQAVVHPHTQIWPLQNQLVLISNGFSNQTSNAFFLVLLQLGPLLGMAACKDLVRYPLDVQWRGAGKLLKKGNNRPMSCCCEGVK